MPPLSEVKKTYVFSLSMCPGQRWVLGGLKVIEELAYIMIQLLDHGAVKKG